MGTTNVSKLAEPAVQHKTALVIPKKECKLVLRKIRGALSMCQNQRKLLACPQRIVAAGQFLQVNDKKLPWCKQMITCPKGRVLGAHLLAELLITRISIKEMRWHHRKRIPWKQWILHAEVAASIYYFMDLRGLFCSFDGPFNFNQVEEAFISRMLPGKYLRTVS